MRPGTTAWERQRQRDAGGRARRRAGRPGPGPGNGHGDTSWAAVLSLMAAGVIGAAQIGKGSAALPVLQLEFGLSSSGAAWFLSVVSAIGAVAGALLGWLGQAVGFRRQVLLGLLAIVVANLGGAAAGSAAWLMAARVGEGLGFVLVVLAAPPLLSEVAGRGHRRLVVGVWGVYMPLGAGLATLLVPAAITLLSWRSAWLIDAGVTALVLLAVGRWVPSTPARRPQGTGGLLQAVRSPGVLCLAVVFGCYAGQYLAVVGLLPTMLVDGGLSLEAAGLVTGMVFLANVPANLLGAFLLHRGVGRWWLIVAGGGWVAVTVWAVHAPELPLPVRIGSVVAYSLLVGVVPSALFSGVVGMSAGTASAGAAVGLLMQGSSLGQLLGPPLVVAVGSTVSTWTGRPVALLFLAAGVVAGGLLYRQLERPLSP
ncbi:CynX/NimT family MFS transporter [Blastococcus saxobsidens]|uniref:Permease of the major facilitator superfamily n=1 Tax=Blastococcus saxobsidens (strain DD2) TaxID=1146883 RepID=H6RIT7_BLASD|nr:MFS transporter [Blastococcus saxobsidens]CCG03479.1 Permease of the major facilitator superfamily [Blastococcus saxobsidens DD2]